MQAQSSRIIFTRQSNIEVRILRTSTLLLQALSLLILALLLVSSSQFNVRRQFSYQARQRLL